MKEKDWQPNGECLCTDVELRAVGGAADEDLLRVGASPQHIPEIRRICYYVLQYRERGNVPAERKALGADKRWGRRGRGVDAMTYIVRNVALSMLPDGPPADGDAYAHYPGRGHVRRMERAAQRWMSPKDTVRH